MQLEKARTKALIALLLDRQASVAERDDAAIDLGDSDDEEVANALLVGGASEKDHETIQASCGEAIASIWLRKGVFDSCSFQRLAPAAKSEAEALIRQARPEWLRVLRERHDRE